MVPSLIVLASLARLDGTPKDTVDSFVDSVNREKWTRVFERLSGAHVDRAARYMNQAAMFLPVPKISVQGMDFVIRGKTSHGLVLVRLQSMSDSKLADPPDDVRFVFEDNDWKIVGGSKKTSVFSQLAEIGKASDKTLATSLRGARRTYVLNHLRRISAAALQFANDHGQKLAFNQSNLRASLGPYIQDGSFFSAPARLNLDLRFNSALKGKSTTDLQGRHNVALFTLGPNAAKAFKDEKTAIGFSDGQAAYVAKGDLPKVNWKG
jgi:hypothetical protein